ncbi:MAG: ComEC/Rec2 family competence protein, partial [Thermomicrobiales bacterium]|nr:ComEC/Rec2 family competence protein [Thermomicrobiales bacterium]
DRPWLWVSGVAAATMAAQAATLPFLLPIHERISLSGLPANISIGPLGTIAFPASAAAGGGAMLWRPLGEALAVPARLSCTAIIGVVDWLAGWRGGVLPVGEATPPTLALVSLFALAACVAVSRDGRRLRRQWPRRKAALPTAARWAMGGFVGGAALATIVALLA